MLNNSVQHSHDNPSNEATAEAEAIIASFRSVSDMAFALEGSLRDPAIDLWKSSHLGLGVGILSGQCRQAALGVFVSDIGKEPEPDGSNAGHLFPLFQFELRSVAANVGVSRAQVRNIKDPPALECCLSLLGPDNLWNGPPGIVYNSPGDLEKYQRNLFGIHFAPEPDIVGGYGSFVDARPGLWNVGSVRETGWNIGGSLRGLLPGGLEATLLRSWDL